MIDNFDISGLAQLCTQQHISLLILHGSRAKNTEGKHSDLDIAVLGDREYIRKNRFTIYTVLTAFFGDKTDLVFLNGAESMITYNVAVNGICLYEKIQGLFDTFKLGAITRYFDTYKFRMLEKAYIKKAIKQAKEHAEY